MSRIRNARVLTKEEKDGGLHKFAIGRLVKYTRINSFVSSSVAISRMGVNHPPREQGDRSLDRQQCVCASDKLAINGLLLHTISIERQTICASVERRQRGDYEPGVLLCAHF